MLRPPVHMPLPSMMIAGPFPGQAPIQRDLREALSALLR
jgi:hypothetical protein